MRQVRHISRVLRDGRPSESAACGVGFVASRHARASHDILQTALMAARCVEHRGGLLADGETGDGAGIMVDIPFELLGYARGEVAVATLFISAPAAQQRRALDVFEETFGAAGLTVMGYRSVPVDARALGPMARETMPAILHAFIAWPACCRTEASFNQQLYLARQRVRTTMKAAGIYQQFFFASLSTSTIVYKALCTAQCLPHFYEDLQNPAFKTRFGIFHRRFSTNTRTAWDKVQPFRLIAHNGEINTIAGNHSSAYAREQALGLPPDELLTHHNVSDSGALNGMVEALKYRSSMPHTEDVLAIMIPPAARTNGYYQFWSRAMEAWDGPAFISYCDGESLGARLDRNGFRPCRWAMTEDHFYLASEAGVFSLDEAEVTAKGALRAGSGVRFDLRRGMAHFRDPSLSRENDGALFDARLAPIPAEVQRAVPQPWASLQPWAFMLSKEELDKLVLPMMRSGKEPIGSMGDTARIALLSQQRRSFFDFFYQSFAQVTNPPLDYLREKMVTDLEIHLGKQPNIFAPKELLPPMPGLRLSSPVLDLHQYGYLRQLADSTKAPLGLRTVELHSHFARAEAANGFRARLAALQDEAVAAVSDGARILLLTDRCADGEHPPLPSLLALRALVTALNRAGLRLECSIVVASGEVRSSHHVAALISFGASAVCPVLPLELARSYDSRSLKALSIEDRCRNVVAALQSGLLKIMSKMGISVVRSYRSSKLFTAVGISQSILRDYFRGLSSPIGGLSMNRLAQMVLRNTAAPAADEAPRKLPVAALPSPFLFKEHAKLARGEKHSMTAPRAHAVHAMLVHAPDSEQGRRAYQRYLELGHSAAPLNLRHLLALRRADAPLHLDAVESILEILPRFGAGAMSFGAISAEAQRDIIVAMRRVGGRSNSGEGGENPYYWVDGSSATVKQVASARFGVTARYLAAGDEVEIKMAQGAKPGEGGQLMGVKVNEDIARARHCNPGVDLISPPPMHDIYSIEDLKQLIFELKQLHPDKPVGVKLVAGAHVGTIAAGVVKAGADVIQISGGSGGTGAATLVSMKHAGVPWELGLSEVHRTLCEQQLRGRVRLRVDGGICTGEDVVMAVALGADEVGLGKLLLVAEGCVMARVCEKNTCPRGIATQSNKYKAKYRGGADDVVRLLHYLAHDVRRHLAELGVARLSELLGRSDLLQANPAHQLFATDRGIELAALLRPAVRSRSMGAAAFERATTPLNQRLCDDVAARLRARSDNAAAGEPLRYAIRSVDRAVLARLSGEIASARHHAHLQQIAGEPPGSSPWLPMNPPLQLRFDGSAGQGFAVYLVSGLDVRLYGEANDSVCKSMSGGRVVIRPAEVSRLRAEQSAIIGNCALYGATGGELFVRGAAGDRFAVRNSGAEAVVEGVGLHACAYMTAGTVAILGRASHNIGSGMTGGQLYLLRGQAEMTNPDYLMAADMSPADRAELERLLRAHQQLTGSTVAARLLEAPALLNEVFVKCVPHAQPQPRSRPLTAKASSAAE